MSWPASCRCPSRTFRCFWRSGSCPHFVWIDRISILGVWGGLILVGVTLASPAMAKSQQPPPIQGGASSTCIAGESWVFRPSWFSHAHQTGERVVQYQPPPPGIVPTDPTYQESGYRHKRSGLAVRGSFDYRHVVETWGAGEFIRPYGEWLYPFRPGATPFGPWGNPQGPWTLPFQSWQNPYGSWNRYGYPYGMVPIPVWPPAQAPPAP